ncbi:rhomboid family membrane protein [Listeria fleischmannii subsp. fleischmannii LU2006-1]|nr:rhomboid family membrane protein [Listeria fleischmannii subsp. fleischmannii LU2006-1]
MSLQDNYVFWLLTNYFLGQENYRLIHLHEEKQELWLDNPNKKDRPVIRIQMRELGWASVVERDVTHVFNVAENLRKQMGRLKLSLVNIYISPFEPVGEKPVFEERLTGKNEKNNASKLFNCNRTCGAKIRRLRETIKYTTRDI